MEQLEQQIAASHNPAEKSSLLIALVQKLYRDNTPLALEYAHEACRLSESAGDTMGMADALLWVGGCSIYCSKYNEALAALEQSISLLEGVDEVDDTPAFYRVRAKYQMGIVHDRLGRRDISIVLFREALQAAQEGKFPYQTATLLNAIGNMWAAFSQFDSALTYYFQALNAWEEMKTTDQVALTCTNIAQVYVGMTNWEQATAYFSRALVALDDDENKAQRAHILMGMGDVCKHTEQYDEALAYLSAAEEMFKSIGDRDGVGHVMNLKGGIHEGRGEFAIALHWYEQAVAIAEETGDMEYRGYVCSDIGVIYHKTGRYTEAFSYFERALEIAGQTFDRWLEYNIHQRMAETYEACGNIAEALKHYKLFSAIKEEVLGAERQQAVAELESRLAIEKAEREKELYRLQSENLELERNLKTKELAATALHLVQKNEFLDRFSRQVSRIINTHSNRTTLLRSLLNEVRESMDAGPEQQSFDKQFEQAQHDFVVALSRYAPALSPAELKVCALLKAGFSSEAIAGLLCISSRTVSFHRNNVRKKLGINPQQDLVAYLHSIEMAST